VPTTFGNACDSARNGPIPLGNDLPYVCMGSDICTDCGKQFRVDPENPRSICFRCHASGISFGFQQGREMWGQSTIKEQDGREIEYVGNRWV
jgi:hypothetical protein